MKEICSEQSLSLHEERTRQLSLDSFQAKIATFISK